MNLTTIRGRLPGAAAILLVTLGLAACSGDDPSPPQVQPSLTRTWPIEVENPPTGMPIEVVEYGFSSFQDPFGDVFSFAAIIENSSAYEAGEVRLDFTALDAEGDPVPDGAWTVKVQRAAPGARTLYGGELSGFDLDFDPAKTAAITVEVRDVQGWWDDPVVPAGLASLQRIGPFQYGEPDEISESIEVSWTTDGDGTGYLPIDLSLAFRDADGALIGGCREYFLGWEVGTRQEWRADCYPPPGTDRTATTFQLDPRWSTPKLPDPPPF